MNQVRRNGEKKALSIFFFTGNAEVLYLVRQSFIIIFWTLQLRLLESTKCKLPESPSQVHVFGPQVLSLTCVVLSGGIKLAWTEKEGT